jgi:hypothetical protein
MRPTLAVVIAAMASACAAPAWAKPQVDPDPMTVSGRFALTPADASLERGRLRTKAVISAILPAELGWDPEAFRAALGQAVAKSLGNFGYGAGPDAAVATPATVELAALQIETQDRAAVVRVRLRLHGDAGPDACLDREASGEFKALSPVRAGDGRRAFGVIATIGLAAAVAGAGGVPTANTFLPDQFVTADAQGRAVNGARTTAKDEGVAPERGDQAVARYAAVNAMQLAEASLIEALGQADACRLAPGAPEKQEGGP